MGKQSRGMSTARKTKQTRQSSHQSAFWNCRGILVTCGGNEIKQIRQEQKLFICRAFQMLNRVRNPKNCSRLMERLRCNIQWTSKELVDRQTNKMIHRKTPWREIECYSLLGAPYIDEAHGIVFKATKKKFGARLSETNVGASWLSSCLVARKTAFTERLHGEKSSVILTSPLWVLLILTRHMAWC